MKSQLLQIALGVTLTVAQPSHAAPTYLSPTALAMSPDGQTLYVACATAGEECPAAR